MNKDKSSIPATQSKDEVVTLAENTENGASKERLTYDKLGVKLAKVESIVIDNSKIENYKFKLNQSIHSTFKDKNKITQSVTYRIIGTVSLATIFTGFIKDIVSDMGNRFRGKVLPNDTITYEVTDFYYQSGTKGIGNLETRLKSENVEVKASAIKEIENTIVKLSELLKSVQ